MDWITNYLCEFYAYYQKRHGHAAETESREVVSIVTKPSVAQQIRKTRMII